MAWYLTLCHYSIYCWALSINKSFNFTPITILSSPYTIVIWTECLDFTSTKVQISLTGSLDLTSTKWFWEAEHLYLTSTRSHKKNVYIWLRQSNSDELNISILLQQYSSAELNVFNKAFLLSWLFIRIEFDKEYTIIKHNGKRLNGT